MVLAAHVSGQYLLICNLVILSLLAAAAAAAATEAKIGHRFFFAAEAFPHLSSSSLPFPHLFQLLLVAPFCVNEHRPGSVAQLVERQ